jgi:hypothetical protein
LLTKNDIRTIIRLIKHADEYDLSDDIDDIVDKAVNVKPEIVIPL